MLSSYKTKLAYKMQLAPDMWLFGFDLQDGQEIQFTAGQYLILNIPGDSEDVSKRMYSIASPAFQKQSFDIVVKIIKGGIAGEYLMRLKVGEEADFQGPAGVFVLKDNPVDKVFFATGAGIAPIRSMILTEFHNEEEARHNYHLFWGLRTVKDVYFQDELHVLSQKYPNFHFYICLSQEQNLDGVEEDDKKHFIIGRVDRGFTTVLGFIYKDHDFYVCGASAVVESLRNFLLQNSVPKEKIFFEKFV